jgi:hypothetical protein
MIDKRMAKKLWTGKKMMDLIDLIYNTAKNQGVGYEEVIEEEIYGYSLRQEILRELKERYEE